MDNVIKFQDFNLDDVLIDEKLYQNILVYDISHKILIDGKPLCVRFNKMDGFIKVYDRNRYLVSFGDEKRHFIYNRIKYLIGVESGITYVVFHNYAKVIADLYYSLRLEKTFTCYNNNKDKL